MATALESEVKKLRVRICEIEVWLLEALTSLYETENKLIEIERKIQEDSEAENS